jgi:hypothetical protein
MSFMSELGGRYIDNGYPILPIKPESKAPGLYTAAVGWSGGYPDWTRHCARPTTLLEFEIWATYPDAGIGVACGYPVGIDIDVVEDAAIATDIERLARRLLGDTPLVRIGMAPKRLLVYRAEHPFAGFKMHPIEVLARGQQFVAHAIHPETGQAYRWIDDSPADVPLSELPAVTEEQCRAFAKEAFELLPAALRPARLLNGNGHNGSDVHTPSPLGRRGTYDAVASALEKIPNDDWPYDDWVSIGIYIKGALGDVGLPLSLRWSAKSANKDRPDYTAKIFTGLRADRAGAGSIYRKAEEYGWRADHSIRMNGAIAWEPGQHPSTRVTRRHKSRHRTARARETGRRQRLRPGRLLQSRWRDQALRRLYAGYRTTTATDLRCYDRALCHWYARRAPLSRPNRPAH